MGRSAYLIDSGRLGLPANATVSIWMTYGIERLKSGLSAAELPGAISRLDTLVPPRDPIHNAPSEGESASLNRTPVRGRRWGDGNQDQASARRGCLKAGPDRSAGQCRDTDGILAAHTRKAEATGNRREGSLYGSVGRAGPADLPPRPSLPCEEGGSAARAGPGADGGSTATGGAGAMASRGA